VQIDTDVEGSRGASDGAATLRAAYNLPDSRGRKKSGRKADLVKYYPGQDVQESVDVRSILSERRMKGHL